MQDAVEAIEGALGELMQAREALPTEVAAELDEVISQARALLESLRGQSGDVSASPEPESSTEPG